VRFANCAFKENAMSTHTGPRTLPEVIADIRATPEHGLLTVAATGEILDGVHCISAIRDHSMDIDEPEMIGGTDLGPNPVEIVLAALGTCQAITYRIWASMLGITLDRVTFETEGDIDLNGLLGLRDGVRPGFRQIRHRVVLFGPETEERYRELAETVDRHCPVYDIVANPIPLERTVEVRAR
jgi:uncharacterized OsmC-like protein